MKKQHLLKNQEGFTLVEIIAVLIILGILAAVAVPRYIDLESSAKTRGLEAAVAELNGRESLVWADTKISSTNVGAYRDSDVWNALTSGSHFDLGNDYQWGSNTGPVSGRTEPLNDGNDYLWFKGESFNLSRRASTSNRPGVWVKK